MHTYAAYLLNINTVAANSAKSVNPTKSIFRNRNYVY